jgi:lambda family phage portal protein
MDLFPTFRKWLGAAKPAPAAPAKRAYEAAQGTRITLDWVFSGLSANEEIRHALKPLREKCRELERNDDYARGFFRLLENNVLGADGITLQMQVRDDNAKMDELANDRIELAWWQWGRVACTDGRAHWRDLSGLILRTMARDGEVLVRFHRGWNGNKFALAVEVIEADFLDESYSVDLGNGRRVVMGVEIDAYNRPIAYHIRGSHPGEAMAHVRPSVRLEASEILHLFIPERPGQIRGVPWLASSMHGLKLLRGYKEAELVAARASAAKLGFLERSADGDSLGGDADDASTGGRAMKAEPGTITELPIGMKFSSWDPSHPTQAFGEFVKSGLRGVATGLGVSYTSFASDLEGVNYSSIRAGLLEEREVWKSLQSWMIRHVCEPIFEEWLKSSLTAGAIVVINGALPPSKFDKFNAPRFRGRRWPWVDPLKDVEASITAINAGLTSRRAVIGEAGNDIYEVFNDQAADAALAKEKQLSFDTPNKTNGQRPTNGDVPPGTDD